MGKPHRIAAGGIVFHEGKVLLVRYPDKDVGTFLVCPGGGVQDGENVVQAAAREVKEETGIAVRPVRVAIIEDLDCPEWKMIKVWMICDPVAGEARRTSGALREGILDVGWYGRDELDGKIVFPPPIMEYDWEELQSNAWRTLCLPSRKADFGFP